MAAVIVLVVVVVVVLPVISLVVMYNRFVRQRTLIDNSWAGVDVELTRRHDLIPNLVETVKGYAAHERTLLEELVAAREAAAALEKEPAEKRQDVEEQMGRALGAVIARVEAYPDLKASTSFLDLQTQLVETEDRIAAARRFYNLNVGAYNTRVGTFPSNVVASWFGFEKRPFFELSDAAARTVPTVASQTS